MTAGRATLAAGIAALSLSLDALAQDKLLAYRDLLHKWNRSFNLTAVRDPEDMVVLHLLDSLAVLPYVPDRRGIGVVDVGSGGGLPGIPLAIARPGQRLVLLDSNHKKASFLRQAVIELALSNVEVVAERVESYLPEPLLDVAISRAYSDLAAFASAAYPLLRPDGRILAMKGVVPHDEIAALPPKFRVTAAYSLSVPGLTGQRCLVHIERAASA